MAGTLRVSACALDVVNPAHQSACARHRVATGLDLDPNRAARGPDEATDRIRKHWPVPREIISWLVRPVGVRDASAEIHRVRVGESGQDGLEEVHQFAHVLVELARLRAGADMRMESHDGQPGRGGCLAQLLEVLVPHPMLGRGTASVACLNMAVAETGVGTHGNRATVADGCKLPEHARRSQVGQDVMLLQDLQRVVAEYVGSEHDPGRVSPAGKSSAHGAQHFVAAHGVDPQTCLADQLQHLPDRIRLHRITRHDLRSRRQILQAVKVSPQDFCVEKIEGRAHASRELTQGVGVEIHRRHESSRNLALHR